MAHDVAADVIITELTLGEGAAVANGDEVSIAFRGWVVESDGQEREVTSGPERHQFRIGEQAVIKGWDLGILGMKPGGSRRVVVPPNLGYRASGLEAAGIPGDATLVFEITLE